MPKTNPSINDKMAELDKLLQWFDSDDFELEAAMGKFSTAQKLAESIEADLLGMKNDITVVNERFDKE